MKKLLEIATTIALTVGASAICHYGNAAAATVDASDSYEVECVENTCSWGRPSSYHDTYEEEVLYEVNTTDVEETMEIASNKSSKVDRACSSVIMLNDFIVRDKVNVDSDGLQYLEWLCDAQ